MGFRKLVGRAQRLETRTRDRFHDDNASSRASVGAPQPRDFKKSTSAGSIPSNWRRPLADIQPKGNSDRCIMRTDTSESSQIVASVLSSRPAGADAAFDRIVAEMKALPDEKVRSVNVDVPTVVSRVLAATFKVVAMRPEILRDAPSVDLALIDKLQDYAWALQEAHVRYLSVGKPPNDLHALAETAEASRRALRVDSTVLVRRGLVDPARLTYCKGLPGYRNVATELMVFATVLLDAWPQLQGKCCTSEDALHQATAVANALLAYVGLREQSPEARAEAAAVRARAFTLLVDAYDEARRAISFLRWRQGDVEKIAPSLFGGRQRVRKKKEENVIQEPTTPTATEPPQSVEPESQPEAPANTTTSAATPSLRSPRSATFMRRTTFSKVSPKPESVSIMSTKTNSAPVSVEEELLVGVAYDRVLPAMNALAPEQIHRVSVDPQSATATVLGALPKLLALRGQLEGLPGFDVTLVDNLENYALALRDANLYYLAETHGPGDIKGLTAEGGEIRATFRADTTMLQKNGVLDGACFDRCTGQPGPKAIATDLGILVTVLRTNWSQIQGKCGIELGELDHADRLATYLLRLLGQRDQATSTPTETSDKRARAFTICKNAYDQVRRAITFVRWKENDVDEIAPSLHAGRRRRPAKTETVEAVAEAPAIAPLQIPATPELTGRPNASPFMA